MEEEELDKMLALEEASIAPLPLKKKYQRVDAVLVMKHSFSNGEQLYKELSQDQMFVNSGCLMQFVTSPASIEQKKYYK